MPSRVWYVSYGSNTNAKRLSAYLAGAGDRDTFGAHRAATDTTPPSATRWLKIPHRLFFAGRSIRWDGTVAFVELSHAADDFALSRAFEISWSQFLHIAAGENGVKDLGWETDPALLPVGGWARLPVPSKYDAVLRVPDVDGAIALTITTGRRLEMAPPPDAYLQLVRSSLLCSADPAEVDSYLAAAIGRSRGEAQIPTPPSLPMEFNVRLSRMRSTGYPAIRLEEERGDWLGEASSGIAVVSAGGRQHTTFVHRNRSEPKLGTASPGELHEHGLAVSPQLFRALDIADAPDGSWTRVTLSQPTTFKLQSGLSGDIGASDHVQLRHEDARQFGRWALLLLGHMSIPVRVTPRPHVATNSIRLSYATRNLAGLERTPETACLQPLDSEPKPGFIASVMHGGRRLLEYFLGAPTVALRSYEGLVGDDARAVVRVHQTALDYLGVASGDPIIVTWATRSTYARVLLQDTDTSIRMDTQLGERTGQQTRLTLGDIDSRFETAPHLRAWVSSSVRTSLGVPVDTVVRLRRNLRHVVLGQASILAFPVSGLLVGALAIPAVPWFAWGVALAVVIVLAVLPVRIA